MTSDPGVDEELDRLDRNIEAAFSKISSLQETVDDLQEENDDLRDEVESLRAQLRSEKGTESGTKIALAKQLTRNEVLRRVNGKTTRDSVTGEKTSIHTAEVQVGPIIEQARANNVDLAYTTVRDAFAALADEWDCFTHNDGGGKNSGKNRRLEIDARQVPAPLVEAFRDDTGASVQPPLTKTLSSGNGGESG
jgi:regulator of replication initiation timing